MKRLSDLLSLFAAVISLLLLIPGQAHAYLDPGTGSYIFQLVLAAIVGALFAVRIFWGRIKSFFQKLFAKGTDASRDEE